MGVQLLACQDYHWPVRVYECILVNWDVKLISGLSLYMNAY